MLEHGLPQRLLRDMCVYLGGAYRLVSQQRLYHAQVGPSLEQGGGKRVSQRVGRDGLQQSRLFGLLLQHDEDHGTREVVAPPVQKHVVFLAGLYLQPLTVHEPVAEFLQCQWRYGHEALLLSFAHHPHILLLRVELREAQGHQLRHAQSAGEEHLDDGAVAVALGLREVDGVFQLVHLLRGEKFRQVLAQHGAFQQFGGVLFHISVHEQEAIEGTHAAENATLRARPYAYVVQSGGKGLQMGQLHVDRRDAFALQEAQQLLHVAQVGVERVAACPPLQLQVAAVGGKHLLCLGGFFRHGVFLSLFSICCLKCKIIKKLNKMVALLENNS